MNIRASTVLKKLRAGQVVSSFKINLADARAVEIAAQAGFDCIWLDLEHCPNDWGTIEKQVLAAKSQNTDSLVRVSRGGYSDYVRPLEMDATGIMVPHVMSLADVQAVVHMTRFHPVGRRPLDGGNADGLYTALDPQEYIRQSNDQRFVILQIEDPEPLDELDQIAALPGYDLLFFGPGDFSQGIGAPGQWDHPKITETRKRIADVCRKHGKFAGTVGSLANFEELIGLGYRFISVGADVVGLGQYCRQIVEGFIKSKVAPSAGIYSGK